MYGAGKYEDTSAWHQILQVRIEILPKCSPTASKNSNVQNTKRE